MDTAGSMLQMVLSLAAVVAVILGLAWATRRMQSLRGTQNADLRVKASLAVGAKERVVIVEAAGQQFLIGVAPGQVSILKSLGAVEPSVGEVPELQSGLSPPRYALRESFEFQLGKLLKR